MSAFWLEILGPIVLVSSVVAAAIVGQLAWTWWGRRNDARLPSGDELRRHSRETMTIQLSTRSQDRVRKIGGRA